MSTRPRLPVIERLGRDARSRSRSCRRRSAALAKRRNAVVLAHNYQRPEVQDVADYVGDSLGLSRQAAQHAGRGDHLRRRALHGGDRGHSLAHQAGAAARSRGRLLARGDRSRPRTCGAGRRSFPDYIAVGYVNTTAEVKAELDYCCTSGNVLDVIDAIPEDKGILFLPDFFLGAHVRRMRPDRRVEVWLGECHVHKGIRAETLNAAREHIRTPRCWCIPSAAAPASSSTRWAGATSGRRDCTSPRPRG